MKNRVIALLLVLSMCLCVSAVAAEGANDLLIAPAPTMVDVTIVNAGELVLTRQSVSVVDLDEDGALTIADALACAHEMYHPDGAAGFGAVESEYGISMTRLWGDDSGAYGYWRNNASTLSLAEPVSSGDYIVAFIYADTVGWSDQFCFFDVQETEIAAGELALTLSGAAFDAEWNPITVPVAGATITVNGEATEAVTDETGAAVVTLPDAGTYVISATSDTATLVPPVAVVTVTAAEEPVEEPTAPVVAADPAVVNVTIANAGELVLGYAEVTAHDVDNDGTLTIADALTCAHADYFEGGAEGFGAEQTQYGLSVTRLWGVENGGAYGYWCNNASAWSLADPVVKGDHVVAFVYADTTGWSDQYSYFNFAKASTYDGELSLTLTAMGYDAEWNRVALPVAGAVITINGEATEYVTNETGDVIIDLNEPGRYVISATSDSLTLVPPVAVVVVSSFKDSCGHWAEDEIETVVAAGLMNGKTDTTFVPNAAMTRAELVTVLWRMAGSPEVEDELTFTDVKLGAYYDKAVIWAAASGIVTGMTATTFGPNESITREQLATFLYRYAVLQGMDVSVGENTNILSYDDIAQLRQYAMAPMQWACGAGIINGTSVSTLSPRMEATRAQVATVLANFLAIQ